MCYLRTDEYAPHSNDIEMTDKSKQVRREDISRRNRNLVFEWLELAVMTRTFQIECLCNY